MGIGQEDQHTLGYPDTDISSTRLRQLVLHTELHRYVVAVAAAAAVAGDQTCPQKTGTGLRLCREKIGEGDVVTWCLVNMFCTTSMLKCSYVSNHVSFAKD